MPGLRRNRFGIKAHAENDELRTDKEVTTTRRHGCARPCLAPVVRLLLVRVTGGAEGHEIRLSVFVKNRTEEIGPETTYGKSAAARRTLPMTARVRAVLE